MKDIKNETNVDHTLEMSNDDDLINLYPTLLYVRIVDAFNQIDSEECKVEWEENKDSTFQLLKKKLCSAPILALPEGSENFVVYCDASHKGR
ncbi:putative reverse transcriptase domain-containing protein [Tanacetum coccineum]|uniref:Reverse transcriptase domain-containing protein n=1 Tax=Tanacetum coccineum TaxID=301880 RepID=A0ABQ5C6J5_9ASTR